MMHAVRAGQRRAIAMLQPAGGIYRLAAATKASPAILKAIRNMRARSLALVAAQFVDIQFRARVLHPINKANI